MNRLLLFLALFSNTAFSQTSNSFQEAYALNSFVPSGLLEAVSFSNTHMREITDQDANSCSGMPLPYGIMGLFENGAGYFIENGQIIANYSGISIANQKSAINLQILAYAKAFNALMQVQTSIVREKNNPDKIRTVLLQLTEIPDSGIVNIFARDAHVYEILKFMNSPEKAEMYQFQVHHFNLKSVFGEDNYNVLSAKRISFGATSISTEENQHYKIPQNKSLQYGPAVWNPAPTCNFSSRGGIAISAITIHTIQGTYSGAISWSQNCASSVSFHYVVRSSDGQITQMVLEEDKGWHVGSENPYTIGYEHEGYVNDASWYTEAMYQNSAALSRDIINSGYGIPALRTYFGPATIGTLLLGNCTKIKGHQHFNNQTHTDPGINWNWEKYYRLINNNPTITTITSPTGNLYDSGGLAGNYQDDERLLWLISPANATTITLNFSAFSVESNYDYMFIYDGNSIDAPLIGMYTGTNSPGSITSTTGSIFLEFRSDCGTVNSGWNASYTSVLADSEAPLTTIAPSSSWQTQDFSTTITDTDNQSGVAESYYLAADKDNAQIGWKANGSIGFAHEDFEDDIASWAQQTGMFTLNSGKFDFSDIAQNNSNAYLSVTQNTSTNYLYEWKQNITSAGANQRAGLHFFCSDPTLPNRGNSYFVYFRQGQNKAQIYKVVNDVFTMQTNDTCVVNQNVEYSYRVTYNSQTGWIKVFVNNVLVTSWMDSAPLLSGNSISLRSGGCTVSFDDVKCYKTRSSTVSIALQADFRYQSSASQNAGKITSLAIDGLNNWSLEDEELYLVDWTIPEINNLADGQSLDIDSTYLTSLSGNWLGSDPHSGISEYQVAVGTSPSLDDVLPWTTNGLVESFTHVLINPIYNQMYYISVRAINGAALQNEMSSDGQRYVQEPSNDLSEELLNAISIYPNPAVDQLTISNISFNVDLLLYATDGKLVYKNTVNEATTIPLIEFANGIYSLVISNGKGFVVKKVEIQK